MLTPRSVRFPLKLKLLTLMLVLIAASLTIFVGIALKIFREDKSAYIFEALLAKASSGQVILSQKLISEATQSEKPKTFEIEQNAVTFAGENVQSFLNNQLENNSAYQLKIIVPNNGEFYQWNDGVLASVSPQEKALLSGMMTGSLYQAVKEIELNDEKWLYAYDYNPHLHYAFVASLPQKDAFAATEYLMKKSIHYGLFVLGLAMILSVFFARPLTAQLEKLFQVTQSFAQGDFTQRLTLKGHDEVSALGDSVNDMAEKIVLFMDEMKEKARLENEVAVAQLVQSSFFPLQDVTDKNLQLYGHFEPASECGGDWWGYLDHGDWRIFFIADATGHGVPAALLTATINCCKSSLHFMLETRKDLLEKPQEILRYMNQAVCGAGKEIQVTCFVASFNRKTHEFIYSNASHTPPLLFPGSIKQLEKNHFTPLMEVNGPRLGQKSDSSYQSKSFKLENLDTVFFYTDGLTEAEDNEGARWGERRLLKSLSLHGLKNAPGIVEGILNEFHSFTKDETLKDDLTMVAMKVIL